MVEGMPPGVPGFPRRHKPPTLAARAKEASPLLAAAGTLAVAVCVALAGYVQSCAAQQQAATAAAQSRVTQTGQAKADVELDAAYQAIATKLDAVAGSVGELARMSGEQGRRIEMLETVVKSGLSGTPAGRRFQPAVESAAPDLQLDDVIEPLPASPAAAARRKP